MFAMKCKEIFGGRQRILRKSEELVQFRSVDRPHDGCGRTVISEREGSAMEALGLCGPSELDGLDQS